MKPRGAAATLAIAAVWIFSCSTTEAPAPDAPKPPRLLENLGDLHHPITTADPQAQRYFDQGLILTYGFNHAAAVASFEEASRLDPDCAMCAWGTAYALGPNINAPMGPDAARKAHAAAQEALARVERGNVTPKERAYVEAVAVRYADPPPADRAALDRAYAEAMRGVRAAHPEDVDAAVLTAEALMDLYPWNYYDDQGRPREHTGEILELLEWAMKRDPQHVGANHYYIHAVEEFTPEKGVPAAERLGTIAPDAGHLVHMPSHIFWRVGRYEDALEINREAAAADERFFAWCRPGAFYRAGYYPHNIHFLWAAAAASGRSELALSTARRLEAATVDQMEVFDFLEEFQSIPLLTLVRFGRWDAVLGTPQPPEERRFLNGIWHYARGLAYTRQGDPERAGAELEALRTVAAADASAALMLAGGTASAGQLLEIGEAHLEGEIAASRGDVDAAVGALRRAVERQDALVYMEPPPWFFPTRQALGAVLLDAGRAEEAEVVYRTDLKQYPANGWSLFGLASSLREQGHNREAIAIDQGFSHAWAKADVELEASRF